MAEKEEKPEKELVAVEAEPVVPPKIEETEDEQDERAELKEDLRLGADEEGTEEEKLEARRAERQSRRARQHEARERDKKELGFLRQRNDQLERKFSELEARQAGSEVGLLDNRIKELRSQVALADQVIAKAINARKGEDAIEAQRIRDLARDALRDLEHAKKQMTTGGDDASQVPLPPQSLVRNANAWINEHDWFDPTGSDEDSLIVSAIDRAMINEGRDPTTKAYWNELTRRAKARLPHRFEGRTERAEADADDEEPAPRGNGKDTPRGGPKFSVGGRQRSLKANEVYISPERKEAMIEAGVWDDPKLRQRYLAQYRKYDRENAAR